MKISSTGLTDWIIAYKNGKNIRLPVIIKNISKAALPAREREIFRLPVSRILTFFSVFFTVSTAPSSFRIFKHH